MDIILEKIDNFNEELKEAISAQDICDLVRIKIYNFIQENEILKQCYEKRAKYYYYLINNNNYTKTFNTLTSSIYELCKNLSTEIDIFDILGNRPEFEYKHLQQGWRENEALFKLLVFTNLNPDIDNVKEVIEQFNGKRIFKLIDLSKDAIKDEALYLELREGIIPLYLDNLKDYLINEPLAKDVKAFSIFDKYCFIKNASYWDKQPDRREAETGQPNKYKSYTKFILKNNGTIGNDGYFIQPHAQKVLTILRWDYLEAINKDIMQPIIENPKNQISNQKQDILDLILEDCTIKQMANQLHLEGGTIKNKLNELYSEYGIEGKTKGKIKKLKEILQNNKTNY